MRILEHPELYLFNGSPQYLSKVSMDDSLLAIASYWGVNLIDKEELEVLKKQILSVDENDLLQDLNQNLQLKETLAKQKIQYEQNVCYIKAIEYFQFNENELVASCPSFGVAVLLIVRQTFKSPLMMTLYAIFVLSASFHAFNGLWTALISLGLLSNMTMQKIWLKVCLLLMFLSIFWGFISIFGSYWLVF
jgi:succinate dehydrogenase / fumarate reductase cytochrome b subunit